MFKVSPYKTSDTKLLLQNHEPDTSGTYWLRHKKCQVIHINGDNRLCVNILKGAKSSTFYDIWCVQFG